MQNNDDEFFGSEAALQGLGDAYARRNRAYQSATLNSDRATRAQADQEQLNWGNDAAQGAMAGSSFGGVGALIGGIAGSAKGQAEAYQARKRMGQSTGRSLANTLLNPLHSLPSFSNGAGAGGAVATALERDKARKASLYGSQNLMAQHEMRLSEPSDLEMNNARKNQGFDINLALNTNGNDYGDTYDPNFQLKKGR